MAPRKISRNTSKAKVHRSKKEEKKPKIVPQTTKAVKKRTTRMKETPSEKLLKLLECQEPLFAIKLILKLQLVSIWSRFLFYGRRGKQGR